MQFQVAHISTSIVETAAFCEHKKYCVDRSCFPRENTGKY